MKLTIIIPALNEDVTIGKVLNDIPESIPGISEISAVVVDDGSTDDTRKIAMKNGAFVISHSKNMGLGAAFKTGISHAIESGTDIMVNIDADGQFNPKDIPKLIAPIVNGDAECTTASRFIDKKLYPKMNVVKFWGNKAMSLLISFLTRRKFYDVSCGMRAYNYHALLNFNLAGRFTYTQEAIINLAYKGFVIKEVPIRVIGKRSNGKSRIASNLFRYALRTTLIILRAFRDYKPLFFFGIISLFFLIGATGFGGFVFAHYLFTGTLFPHKWAGVLAIVFAMIAFAFFIIGLLADMLDRIRMNQEKIIFLLLKKK